MTRTRLQPNALLGDAETMADYTIYFILRQSHQCKAIAAKTILSMTSVL